MAKELKKLVIHKTKLKKPQSAEHKQKLREARKGYVATKETNTKISETMKKVWAERKKKKLIDPEGSEIGENYYAF